MHKIKALSGVPALREGKGKVGPVITDNGNFIVDAKFGCIDAPLNLESKLKDIIGIVETGLFNKMTYTAYIGELQVLLKQSKTND